MFFVIHLRHIREPILVFYFFPFSIGPSIAGRITQLQTTITMQEGQAGTLDYIFETKWNVYILYWYKQLPSRQMVFLIHQEYSQTNVKQDRYSANLEKARKVVKFTISSLQVADSAKYFCVLWNPMETEMKVEVKQKL
ncbi:T-cell receptor alpha chain V region HPB-MLT [Heterocephalus glaber]|nr:T-cell receptor alpha chain V region HPB-MLT [Heterocephalus glaber]